LIQQAAADIFQWEWVDPGDPSQGIRQSSTLCPDGGGVFAQPNAELDSCDLTQAYLVGANLTGAGFREATLANADFTDAQVAEANFFGTTGKGFIAAQLYGTASYKARDLYGVGLGGNDLTGWNFANQNLTGARFPGATLENANLAGATLTGAYFYRATLANANLAGANLTRAQFGLAVLTNADFTDAQVTETAFGWGLEISPPIGFAAGQLYSTASYKARDLHGIWLEETDLTGWNFASQNLDR